MASSLQRKAIIVLGMHRSGTSALTAGLLALGVNLGEVIKAGSEENVKGYYENRNVQDLNDRLLKELGTSWNNPFFWNSIDINQPELRTYFEEAIELLNNCYGPAKVWGVKDPRMCLLLPFWQKAIAQGFNSDTYYIHIMRNPLEVAESLIQRHLRKKFILCGDLLQNILLWFLYHYKALEYVDHDRNILVTFDSLIADSRQQLRRISDFIGLCPNQRHVDDYVHNFLDRKLKHHNKSVDDSSKLYTGLEFILDFNSNLNSLAGKPHFTRLDTKKIIGSIPDLTMLKSSSRIAAPFFLKSIEQKHTEEKLLKYERMQSEFEKCKSREQALDQEVQSQRQEMKVILQVLDDKQQIIQEKQNDLLKLESELSKHTKQVQQLEEQIRILQLDITDLMCQRNRIFNSYSWRITKPLRGIRRILQSNKFQASNSDLPKD